MCNGEKACKKRKERKEKAKAMERGKYKRKYKHKSQITQEIQRKHGSRSTCDCSYIKVSGIVGRILCNRDRDNEPQREGSTREKLEA